MTLEPHRGMGWSEGPNSHIVDAACSRFAAR